MKSQYVVVLSLLLLLSLTAVAAAEATPVWNHTIGGKGVSAVAISGDGRTICAAGEDGLICLSPGGAVQWSSPLRMFDVALPDDGSVVVAGGFDLHIFGADGTTVGGRKVFNVIRSVAVSPDGTVYLASTDGSTILEGTIRGDTAAETDTGEDYFAVALVPGTDYLAAGTESGSVLLSSPGTGTVYWKYRASPKPVNDIAVSDGGRTIAACTGDGMVYALSRTGLLLWSIPFGRPEGVAVSRDGERIAVCGAEGFALYDRSGTKLASVPTAAACKGIALNADATLAVVASVRDVSLYSLDDEGVTGVTAEGTPTATITGDGAGEMPPASPSPDDLSVATPDSPAGPAPTRAAPAALVAVTGLIGTLPVLGRKV